MIAAIGVRNVVENKVDFTKSRNLIIAVIEALVEQQERTVFSEAEDTLTARLQHQLLKLRNILKAQNQMLTHYHAAPEKSQSCK